MKVGVQQLPLYPVPRAILFDLDDTLCDYAAAREARLRVAFSFDGNGNTIHRGEAELAAMVAASIEVHPHGVEHFPALLSQFGIRDPAVAKAAAHWYLSHRFYGLELFATSRKVLQAVRTVKDLGGNGKRRPVGVVTNGPADVQREKLSLLGLRELVDFIVISEEFGTAKPDALIFQEALRYAGVDAAAAVFVGDSPEFDIVGAKAAGMSAIWVNRALAEWDREEPRPDREVRSIAEVPALVGSA